MSIEPRVYVTNDKKIPAQMSGDAGKSLIVNSTEDGYEHQVVGAVTNLTGQIIMWPTNVPPAGYLICDGVTEHDSAQYPALTAILGESSPGVLIIPKVVFPKNSFGVGTLTEEPAEVGTHGHDTDPVADHDHSITINSVGNHAHTISNEVLHGGTYWKVSTSPAGEQTNVNPGVTATTNGGGAHGHNASSSEAGGHTPVVNDHTGTNQPECTLLTFCMKT